MAGNFVCTVAIDLGTSCSGYAFALKHDKTNIYMNKNWGENQGCQTYKTLTSVLTGPNNVFLAFGYDAIAQYSDIVDDGKIGYNLFEDFKMILHKTGNWDKNITVVSKNKTCLPALDVFAL
jgi:hypothetical protein